MLIFFCLATIHKIIVYLNGMSGEWSSLMSNETAQQNDKVFKPPENMHFNIILTLASHFLKVNEQQQKKIYYKQLMDFYLNDHVCFLYITL